MWMPLLPLYAHATPPAVEAVVLVQQGSTSCAGVRISPEGDVATAYHCVAAGGRPRVTGRGGRSFVGRVVGALPSADLAIISVPDAAGGHWLPVGDQVPPMGAEVDVVGHPYGHRAPVGFMEGTLRWSMTRGIVSAVGPFSVQFDAPINPGNSGGPVLDEHGRVVAIVSRKTGGQGLGFGGRGELLAALADEPEQGLRPVGGTLAVNLRASAFADRGGTWSLGPSIEAALRDRVVVTGGWTFGVGTSWDALNFGEVRWLGPEARAGIRQRVFRGPWTLRLDAFAGAAGLQRLAAMVEGNEVDRTRGMEPVWLAGGMIQVGTAGFELSWVDSGATRASVVWRWPGVVTVF